MRSQGPDGQRVAGCQSRFCELDCLHDGSLAGRWHRREWEAQHVSILVWSFQQALDEVAVGAP
jgi:hypothetical protein